MKPNQCTYHKQVDVDSNYSFSGIFVSFIMKPFLLVSHTRCSQPPNQIYSNAEIVNSNTPPGRSMSFAGYITSTQTPSQRLSRIKYQSLQEFVLELFLSKQPQRIHTTKPRQAKLTARIPLLNWSNLQVRLCHLSREI